MPTEVLMPRLADTLVEGTVARWLKAANDSVQVGEPIAEIETDKVTTELTAPASGTLSELLVAEGETVSIGTPLARIRSQGEQEPSSRSPEAPAATGEAAPVTPERRASPLAARIARAHGIDLAQVDTPGSRITRVDVERHLARPGQPLAEVIPPRVEQTPREGSRARQMPASPSDMLLPLTGLRRATAARMSNVRQIPTGCAVVEADVTELEQLYTKERAAWLESSGFPLTYTPYFLYALAQSLRAWPDVRQAFRNNQRERERLSMLGLLLRWR